MFVTEMCEEDLMHDRIYLQKKHLQKKKVFLIFVGVVFMFATALAGCQKQEVIASPPDESGSSASKAVAAPTVEAPSAPIAGKDAPAAAETRTATKRVRDLLAKQGLKVKSMNYLYQDPQNTPEKDEVFVKGNKLKIKLAQLDHVVNDVYVDTIYIDRAAGEAAGYCEKKIYRCRDPNTPHAVAYEKYNKKTPVDWIKGVAYAEEVGSETMDNRDVLVVEYKEKDAQVKMWIDTFYGVPLKIEVMQGSKVDTSIFEDISFNSVDDSSLVHADVSDKYAVGKIDNT